MNPSMESDLVPCRICGDTGSMEILHRFGAVPVAGYLEPTRELAERAPRFDLDIAFCPTCSHPQQAHAAARTLLIDRVYADYQPTYAASRSVPLYMQKFLQRAIERARLVPGESVVDIGSNDGSVLNELRRQGFRAIGIEPSSGLAAAAREQGLDVLERYFDETISGEWASLYPKARLVLTRHTLEHSFEPLSFMRGIAGILDHDGLAVIEVPYVRLQMMNNQFQSLTFQHESFFTVASMIRLARAAGLHLIDMDFVTMDAGSMVAYCRLASDSDKEEAPALAMLCQLEEEMMLHRAEGYAHFFDNVERQRTYLKRHLEALSNRQLVAMGYGAGGKGQSLIQLLNLTSHHLRYVIDDIPGNQGRYIPGAGIEVIGSDDPRVEEADVVLVTAPTHVREIVAKERERERIRARFLATAPDCHYVVNE